MEMPIIKVWKYPVTSLDASELQLIGTVKPSEKNRVMTEVMNYRKKHCTHRLTTIKYDKVTGLFNYTWYDRGPSNILVK